MEFRHKGKETDLVPDRQPLPAIIYVEAKPLVRGSLAYLATDRAHRGKGGEYLYRTCDVSPEVPAMDGFQPSEGSIQQVRPSRIEHQLAHFSALGCLSRVRIVNLPAKR